MSIIVLIWPKMLLSQVSNFAAERRQLSFRRTGLMAIVSRFVGMG